MEKLPESTYMKIKFPEMPWGKHKGTPLDKLPGNYFQWLVRESWANKIEDRTLRDNILGLDSMMQDAAEDYDDREYYPMGGGLFNEQY